MAGLARAPLLAGFDEHLKVDFTSNDYLGLAASAEPKSAIVEAISRGVPLGSGGSRLLRGNDDEHEALEEEAACVFGADSALFFSSDYTANSALLSTLPQRGDLVVHDELIHASSREGFRLGRAAARTAAHNDVQSFADTLRTWRRSGGTGRAWLVVESLYTMDGDKAPLGELLSLALANDAFLVIDEAHATGVFGSHGGGLAEGFEIHENVITVRTCGKALGCEGALICSHRTISDFLLNRGRGFIFSTAPLPLTVAAVRAALKILTDEPADLAAFAAKRLGPLGAGWHESQIISLIVGGARETTELAAVLQAAGFNVRAVRPPTVPEGTSRLRISITLDVDKPSISALANAIWESSSAGSS